MTDHETTDRESAFFALRQQLAPAAAPAEWDIVVGDGPVVVTAIHDGHAMRPSLQPRLRLDAAARRREEDPMTGVFTSVGDVRVRARNSRFEVDLNRPRDQAVYATPEDCWGLQVWEAPLPDHEVARSLESWDRFYAMTADLLDRLLSRWGRVLLVDVHSYNHRRDGHDAEPAPQHGNPDIELGLTTLDPARWGDVAGRFADALRQSPVGGRHPDVRANVRFPTGGHFPEWVYATYGERVCTISPEYKKIFMDEWAGTVDIAALEDLRAGLQRAVDAVRPDFLR